MRLASARAHWSGEACPMRSEKVGIHARLCFIEDGPEQKGERWLDRGYLSVRACGEREFNPRCNMTLTRLANRSLPRWQQAGGAFDPKVRNARPAVPNFF